MNQVFPTNTMKFVNQMVLDTGIVLTGHGITPYDAIKTTDALMLLERVSASMFCFQQPIVEREVLYQEDLEAAKTPGFKNFKIIDEWELEKETSK